MIDFTKSVLDLMTLNADASYKMTETVSSLPNSLKDYVFTRPAPVDSIRSQSTSSTFNNTTSDSDTQSDSDCHCRPHRRKTTAKCSSPINTSSPSIPSLPPIGVFWDIENCNVPKGCSAVLVAQVIRASFFEGYREAEFVVVCDVTKEPSKVIEELNDAQVNLIHVPSLHKNAADEKLRQSMRRFADTHGSPSAVVLITGDINFISDVCDLRHRRKIHVILLHRDNVSESLLLCANENHNIVRLFEALPQWTHKNPVEPFLVTVFNLPDQADQARIRNRLKRISENCGGRVGDLLGQGMATLKFTSKDLAQRAQKRMAGADVFGNKISVGEPIPFLSTTSAFLASTVRNQRIRDVTNTGAKTPDNMRSIRKTNQDCDGILVPQSTNKSQGSSKQVSSKNLIPVHVTGGIPNRKKASRSPYGSDDQESSKPAQNFFQPINATPKGGDPIELQVTNLDQCIEAKEMKKVLLNVFSEHVIVLHISVFIQSDGYMAAHVRVSNLQDAQLAISQLHRKKVGFKRIMISYVNSGPSPQLVRSRIVSLLVDVPSHHIPLFKFCELFESRYLTSISVSDLYKMKDVCIITEDKSGRMIGLNPIHRNTPSPALIAAPQICSVTELPRCELHAPVAGSLSDDKGWAEQEMDTLPCVRIPLKVLTSRIHSLIQSHRGSIPLPSLPWCYAAQFHKLEMDPTGVPLEHLVSCVPTIEIYQDVGCVKYLRFAQSQVDQEEVPTKCVSPPLVMQQSLFSRELIDLLKTTPHCQLAFRKFIPAYHHHFGRQCRVADYGYTKLIELLEALPHIVQVMGEGENRRITLSHKAQIRRFTSDLLRLLKAQASKQVLLSEFPTTFQQTHNKEWDIVDYGVCDIEDMLNEISQTTVSVQQTNGEVVLSIPKREQTAMEKTRMKKFASEVTDMPDGERKVSLTLPHCISILSNQISALINMRANGCILLADIPSMFKQMYGFALKPESCGCKNLLDMMHLLRDTITICDSGYGGPMAKLVVNREPSISANHTKGLKVFRVFVEQNQTQMSAAQFLQAYWKLYKESINVSLLASNFPNIVCTNNQDDLYLTKTMNFAAEVYHLLYLWRGAMPLATFEYEFYRKYGRVCQTSELFTISGVVKVNEKTVQLDSKLNAVGIKLPNAISVGPPKPDTPPKMVWANASNSTMWSNGSPMTLYHPFSQISMTSKYVGLPIDLPPCQTDVDPFSTNLTSPTSSLLDAHKNPANYVPLHIQAPDASQLPMPTAFNESSTNADGSFAEYADSGSGNSTPSRVRRKGRLAANFSTPILT